MQLTNHNEHTAKHTITAMMLVGVCLVVIGTSIFTLANAQNPDQLRKKIQNRNNRIQELEKEIKKYESQIQAVQSRQQTLQSKIEELELNRQRLQADIQLNQEKIDAVNADINSLSKQIDDKENKILSNKQAIAGALREIHKINTASLAEKVLQQGSLAKIWSNTEMLNRFQRSLQQQVDKLTKLKKELAANQRTQQANRKELVSLKESLAAKKEVVLQQKSRQNQLLEQTENKESNYQQLLAEKRRQKKQFEQQLQAFERQLEIAIDASKLPKKGTTVFRYPFDGDIQITQQFGGTRFAKQNPQAYGRPFHNGTDFGLPVGTEIKTVQGGRVVDTGNTDRINGCFSYGKWILIEHNNGLSTLYAHLSQIGVSPNETVNTREVIGYSGNSGYSTGPHLHLTTYATEGVRVVRLGEVKEQTNCGAAEIPVAATDAYLNPMSYLP